MDIQHLVAEYGDLFYLATFAWTFLEGETFVIFAGFAAHQGLLSLPLLIVCAWAGSFTGDQLWFFVGRRYGHHLLRRYPRWQGGVESALALARKYDTGFILTFRFIYGVRNISSFALGMSGLPWLRFMILNLIAAGLWATMFAGIGYLFGQAFEAVLGEIAKTFGLVMLGLFLLAAWTAILVHRRQKRKAGEVEGAMENEAVLPRSDSASPPT